MKHSQDYYRNRKLVKELQHADKRFRPKDDDVITWFNILNEQVFGNKLKPLTEMYVKRHNGFHAFFHYWPKSENCEPEISMNTTFKTKKLFVEILAHEMIHYFQYSYNEPLGHGPTFWAWRDNLQLKGLTLHKVA